MGITSDFCPQVQPTLDLRAQRGRSKRVVHTLLRLRYGDRLDDRQMPKSKAARQRLAQQVGIDGFALPDVLDAGYVPAGLRDLPAVKVLRWAWQRHYAYEQGEVRFEGIEGGSPKKTPG